MLSSSQPQPSLMACAGRRVFAKLVDVTLFGAMSLVVGRLLVPDQVSLGGIVPAFGTTLWALTFFVAADTVCARLFGATPGEFLAGVRVCMADGSRLTWSARQDRTTDALVDGTIGAASLLRSLVAGKPASYDKDWRVEFRPLGGALRVVVGALAVASLAALMVVGLWLTVIKPIGADSQVATSKVLRYFGFPVRAVWANPATGLPVELPDGWYVRRQVHRANIGDTMVEFRCDRDGDACRVVLGVTAWPEAGYLSERDTMSEAIEKAFNLLLDEGDMMVVDDRARITGEARLDQIYMAELSGPKNDPQGGGRYGLAWFSDRKYAWVLSIEVPRREGKAMLSDDEQAFALSIVQSAFSARGR